LFESNSAANEWCAIAGADDAITRKARAKKAAKPFFIEILLAGTGQIWNS
jgi:hypothetical protein